MGRLTFDFETRSLANLKKTGALKYSLDPSTQPTCLAFKERGNPKVYLLKFEMINRKWQNLPQDFRVLWKKYIKENYEFSGHNVLFDCAIYKNILVARYGWPDISFERFRCTAAKAAACALPRNLEGAGESMHLTTQKDKNGYVAMMATCKPTKQWNAWNKAREKVASGARVAERTRKKAVEPEPPVFLEYEHNPAVWEALYKYCKIDVATEELLDEALPDLIPTEQEIWFLNQRLNWRGLKIDIPTVEKITGIMNVESKIKLKELDTLTMGLVTKPGARKSILEFLALEGIELPDIKAKTVEDILKGGTLNPDMRRLLEIRQQLSKTSTKKYQSFLDRAGKGGRVRDILLYHGASTGRDTGTGIQPHNFPRGAIRISKDRPYAAIENVIECDVDTLKLLYGDNLSIVFSSILRNMIVPSEGCELFVADFSKIEVAVLWWLADNWDGLKILTSGKDPYIYQAAANLGKTYEEIEVAEKAGEQWALDARQLGKAQILGCLAKGTLIFCKTGLKAIEEITENDEIWDGLEFVKHGGLVRKGLKPVIYSPLLNINATHDHWVKQNGYWQSFGEIVLNADMLHQRSDVFLLDGRLLDLNLKSGQNAVSFVAAYVELKKRLESTNFGWVKQQFALTVPSLLELENPNLETIATLLMTRGLEDVGKLVFKISKKDARGGMTPGSNGMAVAAFDAPLNHQEISWNTLLHLMGLINGGSPWTELIMTGITNPETYESLVSRLTTKTEETFDILNVGPKNQFQAEGKIVHNCGFRMSWSKFKNTAMDQYRLKLTNRQSFDAVKSYRTANDPVVKLWSEYENAAIEAVETGKKVKVGKCVFFCERGFLWIRLPSGRRLAYRSPSLQMRTITFDALEICERTGKEIVVTKTSRPKKTLTFLGLDKSKKKLAPESTHGGVVTENIVQACARDLMMRSIVKLEKAGYTPLLTVHDEAICEVKKGKGQLVEFEQIMCSRPSWADENLPLGAKGYSASRYRK